MWVESHLWGHLGLIFVSLIAGKINSQFLHPTNQVSWYLPPPTSKMRPLSECVHMLPKHKKLSSLVFTIQILRDRSLSCYRPPSKATENRETCSLSSKDAALGTFAARVLILVFSVIGTAHSSRGGCYPVMKETRRGKGSGTLNKDNKQRCARREAQWSRWLRRCPQTPPSLPWANPLCSLSVMVLTSNPP